MRNSIWANLLLHRSTRIDADLAIDQYCSRAYPRGFPMWEANLVSSIDPNAAPQLQQYSPHNHANARMSQNTKHNANSEPEGDRQPRQAYSRQATDRVRCPIVNGPGDLERQLPTKTQRRTYAHNTNPAPVPISLGLRTSTSRLPNHRHPPHPAPNLLMRKHPVSSRTTVSSVICPAPASTPNPAAQHATPPS